ncbi:MAG: hypothetical protein M0Z69_15270 [Actinomycetota bacterium]|nr:hypothetical protein [Actinomycetota bacterium]
MNAIARMTSGRRLETLAVETSRSAPSGPAGRPSWARRRHRTRGDARNGFGGALAGALCDPGGALREVDAVVAEIEAAGRRMGEGPCSPGDGGRSGTAADLLELLSDPEAAVFVCEAYRQCFVALGELVAGGVSEPSPALRKIEVVVGAFESLDRFNRRTAEVLSDGE